MSLNRRRDPTEVFKPVHDLFLFNGKIIMENEEKTSIMEKEEKQVLSLFERVTSHVLDNNTLCDLCRCRIA